MMSRLIRWLLLLVCLGCSIFLLTLEYHGYDLADYRVRYFKYEFVLKNCRIQGGLVRPLQMSVESILILDLVECQESQKSLISHMPRPWIMKDIDCSIQKIHYKDLELYDLNMHIDLRRKNTIDAMILNCYVQFPWGEELIIKGERSGRVFQMIWHPHAQSLYFDQGVIQAPTWFPIDFNKCYGHFSYDASKRWAYMHLGSPEHSWTLYRRDDQVDFLQDGNPILFGHKADAGYDFYGDWDIPVDFSWGTYCTIKQFSFDEADREFTLRGQAALTDEVTLNSWVLKYSLNDPHHAHFLIPQIDTPFGLGQEFQVVIELDLPPQFNGQLRWKYPFQEEMETILFHQNGMQSIFRMPKHLLGIDYVEITLRDSELVYHLHNESKKIGCFGMYHWADENLQLSLQKDEQDFPFWQSEGPISKIGGFQKIMTPYWPDFIDSQMEVVYDHFNQDATIVWYSNRNDSQLLLINYDQGSRAIKIKANFPFLKGTFSYQPQESQYQGHIQEWNVKKFREFCHTFSSQESTGPWIGSKNSFIVKCDHLDFYGKKLKHVECEHAYWSEIDEHRWSIRSHELSAYIREYQEAGNWCREYSTLLKNHQRLFSPVSGGPWMMTIYEAPKEPLTWYLKAENLFIEDWTSEWLTGLNLLTGHLFSEDQLRTFWEEGSVVNQIVAHGRWKEKDIDVVSLEAVSGALTLLGEGTYLIDEDWLDLGVIFKPKVSHAISSLVALWNPWALGMSLLGVKSLGEEVDEWSEQLYRVQGHYNSWKLQPWEPEVKALKMSTQKP